METNTPITFGSIQNPYKEFTLVLQPGAVSDVIYYDFDYFRVLSADSTGLQAQFGGTGTFTSVIGAGIGLKFPQAIQQLRLQNVGGAALTITFALMIGQIYDDRLNVSGNINVVNAPGECLEVKNCFDEPILFTQDDQLDALLKDADLKRNALTSIQGATFASAAAATVVAFAAGANTNGAILRLGGAECANASTTGRITSGGNDLLRVQIGATVGGVNGEIRDIYIPAGNDLTLIAGTFTYAWYDLL